MKKLAILSAFLALPLALVAQMTSPTASIQSPARGPADVAGLLYAANFAHWTVSPTDMGTRWTSAAQCYGTSGGVTFPLFSTSAPITIVDLSTPANTETVTPSNAFYSGSGCSVSLPATHSHSNYYLQSGTIGLQEALNWIGSGYAVVVLTPDWQAMGGTTAMITGATAGANATILDDRSSSQIAYSGTTPASQSTGTGKNVLATSPSLVTPNIGAATFTTLTSATKCVSAASPAVCAAAPAGFVNVAAGATTVVVDTTAITGSSTVLVQEDPSLSTALSVTCNATAATAPPTISARTAGTSFTITTTAPTTNPRCFSYVLVN
jgi:hypothetical protein